jgi:hypothetical protein
MTLSGGEKLKDWIMTEGRKSKWVAEQLHCSVQSITYWCKGDREPSHFAKVAIEFLTDGKVKVEDWE